ncbi:hypothetical protein HanPI659440_Chr00c04g0712811 [Helianthus annuus]|nr:hypothetical protein HanPI659440_Chr00c04g0712811 [Helianthus annuus]
MDFEKHKVIGFCFVHLSSNLEAFLNLHVKFIFSLPKLFQVTVGLSKPSSSSSSFERRARPQKAAAVNCPRCDSTNTSYSSVAKPTLPDLVVPSISTAVLSQNPRIHHDQYGQDLNLGFLQVPNFDATKNTNSSVSTTTTTTNTQLSALELFSCVNNTSGSTSSQPSPNNIFFFNLRSIFCQQQWSEAVIISKNPENM